MKRTINQGRIYGIVSGLGAATADAVYGILAEVGFGVLMELLMMVLGIFAGSLLWWLLLCTVGSRLFGLTRVDHKPLFGNPYTAGTL